MSEIIGKFTDLSKTYNNSWTPNIGVINLEGHTG